MSKRFLVRLYPRAWRERYGEEFALLLESTSLSAWMVVNVVESAGREWLLRTALGLWMTGAGVPYASLLLATYLTGAVPAPTILISWGGVSILSGSWLEFLVVSGPILALCAIYRSGHGRRTRVPSVRDAEFLRWIVATLVVFTLVHWGQMLTGGRVGSEAKTLFDLWRSAAPLTTVMFILLRNPKVAADELPLTTR